MNIYAENIYMTIKAFMSDIKYSLRMKITQTKINRYYNAQTRPEKFFEGF